MSEITCRSPAPLRRQRPMRRSIPSGFHAEKAVERNHLALKLALASSRRARASGLQGNEFEVSFVAMAARFADRELAFVDFGGSSISLKECRSQRVVVDGYV